MNHEKYYLTVHVFMIGSIGDKFMAYVTETSTGANRSTNAVDTASCNLVTILILSYEFLVVEAER